MFKNFFNRMYYGKSNKKDLLKEDMATNKFQLFFEILGVRFWDLVKLNLIFVVFALPLIIWTYLNINALVGLQASGFDQEMIDGTWMQYLLGLIPCLVLLGPALCGFTYVIKKFAADRHAWLWSDFKEHSLSNLKQSMLLMLIIGVSIYIFDRALAQYGVLIHTYQFMVIFKWMLITMFAVVLISTVFAFPMMVTYKLKLSQIIKNSILLAFANLPLLVLLVVIVLAPLVLFLLLALSWAYALLIAGVYYMVFGVAFSAFILNSFTNGVFSKYMKQENNQENDEQNDQQGQSETQGNETGQIEE